MSTTEKVAEKAVQQDANALLIQGILKEILPVIIQASQANALTPDLINELKKPYVDPVEEARNARLRRDTQQELLEQAEAKKFEQDNCPHITISPSGQKTISIALLTNLHTFVGDDAPRGYCMHCQKFFQPGHWEIDYDPNNKRGKNRWVEADAQYHLIEEIILSKSADGTNYF